MSRYGINYYGLANYGTESTVVYLSNTFTATPIGYGSVKLTWNTPTGTWSKIKLVRNSYGFPLNDTDGTALDINKDGNYYAYYQNTPTAFVDTGLNTNAFYYYSLFVYSKVNYSWVKVADVAGLSVKDYGYADRLVEYLPEIYTSASATEVSTQNLNTTLVSFLSIFGFELSKYHTLTNLINNRYDTNKVYGDLIPLLLQEFGESYEPQLGYQQQRILLRNILELNKTKGSLNGVSEFIKSFTGWSVSTTSSAPLSPVNGITVGHNLMLDYNDSSFEESVGHWKSSNGVLSCLKNRNVTSYQITSNVATVTVGTHSYLVGHQITIGGSALPIFNVSTPVTITAVTATTISFALTASNMAATNAWNFKTGAYPILYPYPSAWSSSDAPAGYPNKQSGLLSVSNAGGTTATVTLTCGDTTAPLQQGIPVTAGQAYTFSVIRTVWTGGTVHTVTLGINWYDRFQNLISSSTNSTVSNSIAVTGNTSWVSANTKRLSTSNNVAPTGAYYAIPTISIASVSASGSADFTFFDCAQFEQSTTMTAFDEARQLHIVLKATRINELLNPNFELISGTYSSPVVTPWTLSGGGATATLSTATRSPDATILQAIYYTITSNTVRIETTYTNDFTVGDSIVAYDITTAAANGTFTVTAVGEAASGQNPYVEYVITGSNPNVTRTALVTSPSNQPSVYKAGHSYLVLASSTTAKKIASWDGSTNSQLMPIYYPSANYTFSTYVCIDDQYSSTAETVAPYIKWYDSTYTAITPTVTGTVSTGNVTAFDSDWNRISVTAQAPSNAAYAEVGVTWTPTANVPIYLDFALFEHSSLPFAYFDGNSGSGSYTDYSWENNVANTSRSHFYKNKYNVIGRTASPDFANKFTLGTTYALYLAQPQT